MAGTVQSTSSSSTVHQELEVEGNLQNPQCIHSLHFKEEFEALFLRPRTLSVWFFRTEGMVWGVDIPPADFETSTVYGQRVSLPIMLEVVQRSYSWGRSWPWDYSDEGFADQIFHTFFAEDALLTYDMYSPEERVKVRCHHGSSPEECNRKLRLRRRYYFEGLYHVTLIFQKEPESTDCIAVEVLARRSADDILPPGICVDEE